MVAILHQSDYFTGNEVGAMVKYYCKQHKLLSGKVFARFAFNTYPVNFGGITGLPYRVDTEN